jgi:hypothetical protein
MQRSCQGILRKEQGKGFSKTQGKKSISNEISEIFEEAQEVANLAKVAIGDTYSGFRFWDQTAKQAQYEAWKDTPRAVRKELEKRRRRKPRRRAYVAAYQRTEECKRRRKEKRDTPEAAAKKAEYQRAYRARKKEIRST